jgi:GNAT superfamily N-acetyltransferase
MFEDMASAVGRPTIWLRSTRWTSRMRRISSAGRWRGTSVGDRITRSPFLQNLSFLFFFLLSSLIYTVPEYRRHGLARRIVGTAISSAGRRDCAASPSRQP